MLGKKPRRLRKGNADLSKEDPDGTGLRRRYAFYTASLLLFLSAIITLLVLQHRPSQNASPAVSVEAYKLEHSYRLDPIAAHAEVFEHTPTGMKVFTVIPDDRTQDATFGMSFRMKVDNNHGAANVVEHSIMDGSEQYPVKDPFNQLAQGSLQTFIDSWTHKDRTSFVVSSRNKQDFKNSIKVYLDALFHPLFVKDKYKWIFRQEGWRVEEEDGAYVRLHGNAVNEAKAAQMNPVPTLINTLFRKLFPNHPYKYNSRGYSKNIVDLTHEETVEFYNKTYHPSNAQAFCFGPEEYVVECLNTIDPVIKDFGRDEKLREATSFRYHKLTALDSDITKVPYAASESEESDYRVAVAWVLNAQPMNGPTEAAWFIIEELLFKSSSSVVKRIAKDKGYGYNIPGGLEFSVQQWMMILGLSGIPSEDEVASAVDEINNGILNIVENGINEADLKAAINQVDFRFRDDGFNHEPLGVKMFGKVINKWNYDLEPKTQLMYKHYLDEVIADIEENGSGVLIDLMTKHLIDNQHKVAVELFPSSTVAQTYRDQDNSFFNRLESELSKEDAAKLVKESNAVQEHQEKDDSPEDLLSIPRLSLHDLDPNDYELNVTVDYDLFGSGVDAIEVEVPQSYGIAYIDFAMDISHMDFDDVVLLPFFCQMMQEAGTEKYSADQLAQAIETNTGSLEIYPLIEDILSTQTDHVRVVPDGTHLSTKIVFSGSAIAEQGGMHLYELIQEILYRTNFRNKKVAVHILKTMIEDMEDAVLVKGDKYTTYRIESRYSFPGYVREQWKGVTQLMNLKRILYEVETDWTTLADRLEKMRDAWIYGSRSGMMIAVAGDEHSIREMRAATEVFLGSYLGDPNNGAPHFPDFSKTTHAWVTKGLNRMKQTLAEESRNEVFLAPTRVNHVGKGGILFDAGEEIHGSDAVVTQFISGFYLYNKLRFSYGALAASAELDPDSGAMVYQSRSDPNILETLQVYEDASDYVFMALGDRNDGLPVEVIASIVGTIGELDGSAIHPSHAGRLYMGRQLIGETKEVRQKWRDEILRTSREDFMAMMHRVGSWGEPSIVVVASPRHYTQAHKKGGLNLTSCDYSGFSCAGS